MSKSSADDTQEYPTLGPAAAHGFSSAVAIDVAGLSHTGLVRANNEDHFLIVRFGRFLETLGTNLPAAESPGHRRETGYAMVVADGMGGHAAGEVASKLAISSLIDLALTTPDWILRLEDPSFVLATERRASERFLRVDRILAERAKEDPGLGGFGTTMIYAASLGRDLFVAHLGDSRAYLFRKGALRQLTRDHTLAQRMADEGRIDQEEVATHHLRHVLVRTLGRAAGEAPDMRRTVLEDGDRLLLCSDGLTEMVSDDVVAEILAVGRPARETCEDLVKRALAAGGKDNVTVIVAGYKFPPAEGQS
jgi:serine/threonine protein phosphatase PrpC